MRPRRTPRMPPQCPRPTRHQRGNPSAGPENRANRQAAPPRELHAPVAQLDSRRNDDLVARGAHLLDRLHGDDDRPASLAPALARRAAAVGGKDLAVRPGDEALDDVSVVLETAIDEVGAERLRVAARGPDCLHRAVLLREVDGGHGSLRSRPRSRLRPDLRSRWHRAYRRRAYAAGVLMDIRIGRRGA